MGCCSGLTQTKTFKVTLYWRQAPDKVEHRLLFSVKGTDGHWVGEGSASYDLGTAPLSCGLREARGPIVVRTNLVLDCAETETLTHIKGVLQIMFGPSRFQMRLKSIDLDCTKVPAAEWDLLFLRELGQGHVLIEAVPQ